MFTLFLSVILLSRWLVCLGCGITCIPLDGRFKFAPKEYGGKVVWE